MTFRNTASVWGWPARALHWSMAAIIVFMLVLGTYMTSLSLSAERFELTQLHKSWGFVVFSLACIRVVWRFSNRAPEQPEAIAPWRRRAAQISHIAFYALMFAIPLSGWLMASASPLNDDGAYPVQIKNMVFGLFELPDPIAPGDRSLEQTLKTVHMTAAWTLAGLLVVHVGAALQHHFLVRDDVLKRMTTGR